MYIKANAQDINLEIRCPHCNEVMVITEQYETSNDTIAVELYPCEYCHGEYCHEEEE